MFELKKNNKELAFFILKFFLIFFIIEFIVLNINIYFFNSFLAFINGSYLGLFVQGNVILLNNTKFVIDNSCTGLVSVAMLVGLTLPLKVLLKKKLNFLFFGALLLLVINFFRIFFLLILARIGFDADLIHTLTWFVMSGIVIAMWYFFIKIILKAKNFSELI